MPTVFEIIRDYRRELRNREARQFAEMGKRWVEVKGNIDFFVRALAEQIEQERKAGKVITPSQIDRLDRYQELLRQTIFEVEKYQQYATRTVSQSQRDYAMLGADMTRAQIRQAMTGAGVSANFKALPIEAVASSK